jgi:trk system potassium uptake protein TrkA
LTVLKAKSKAGQPPAPTPASRSGICWLAISVYCGKIKKIDNIKVLGEDAMKIIIIGAGTVGLSLAEHLAGLNHQVTLIEQNKPLCESVGSKIDVFILAGIGSDPALLREAGISSADMLIAVTPSDETNLLACNFAMQNGVKKRIARVKSNLYTAAGSCISLQSLGVTHVIEPEKEVAKKIRQYVELPGVIETANFQSDNVYLREYQITEDMPVAHKSLIEIRDMAKGSPILIVAIIRQDKIIPPGGNQRLLPQDKILAIMPKESFKAFCSLINTKTAKLKKIVVSGNSLTAILLAQNLKPLSEQIILLDADAEHAHWAASMLEDITVYHGDSTDIVALQETNIENSDFFIAASDDSEYNTMSCLMAKAEGAKRTLAIRNKDRHNEMFKNLGINHIISPQDITLEIIMEDIQTVSLGAYLKLATADITIVRIKVSKKSPVSGKALMDLNSLFRKSITVGCLIRQDSVIIPWGQTRIEAQDEAIILCQKADVKRVKKLFSPEYNTTLKP